MNGTDMSLERRIKRLESLNDHGAHVPTGSGVRLYWPETELDEADRERWYAEQRETIRCLCGLVNCPAMDWQQITLVWLPHKDGSAADAP